MLSDYGLYDRRVQNLQRIERCFLVGAHEAGITYDIRRDNGGEATYSGDGRQVGYPQSSGKQLRSLRVCQVHCMLPIWNALIGAQFTVP
jgi:hypothetical protein